MSEEPNSYIVNEAMTHLGLDFEMFEEGTCKAAIIEPAYDHAQGIIYVVCLVWTNEDDVEMCSVVMLVVNLMGVVNSRTVSNEPTGR